MKVPNIKFDGNPPSGSCPHTCGRTDGETDITTVRRTFRDYANATAESQHPRANNDILKKQTTQTNPFSKVRLPFVTLLINLINAHFLIILPIYRQCNPMTHMFYTYKTLSSGIQRRVARELLASVSGKSTASIITAEYMPTKLHGVTCHKTVIFTLSTVETSNLG
jgi:hypothetical protein